MAPLVLACARRHPRGKDRNQYRGHEAEQGTEHVTDRPGQWLHNSRLMQTIALALLVLAPLALAAPAQAQPYAAIVVDARTGEVLHSRNADTRLHPASLTKMLTLYIAFDAIRRGEISLDTMVTVSAKAAAEPPSRLGLRAGQRISLQNLIRAAAIRSANDAATAIGEAISGSEAAFAERMNRTARALGMTNSTFRNAHGLTREGHLSTARDMNTLGRRLFYDFPQYYNLFSRLSADAGVARVNHTNRRFLESYRGADGIKTGYTRAAGFTLTASAERGGKRIIATVFGGTSTAQRNARMAELMDMGFNRAPNRVAEVPPPAVSLNAAATPAASGSQPAAKTIRLVTAVARSPRPQPRPIPQPAEEMLIALQQDISGVIADVAAQAGAEPIPFEVVEAAPPLPDTPPMPRPEAQAGTAETTEAPVIVAEADETTPAPMPRPETLMAEAPAETGEQAGALAEAGQEHPADRPETVEVARAETGGLPFLALSEPIVQPRAPAEPLPFRVVDAAAVGAEVAELAQDIAGDTGEGRPENIVQTASMAAPSPARVRPHARPGEIVMTAATRIPTPTPARAEPEPEVVTRVSTSGGRHWGVNLGRHPTRDSAERLLLQTALSEPGALDGALRRVVQRPGGWEANLMGLSQDQADLACRRLQTRSIQCFTLGP